MKKIAKIIMSVFAIVVLCGVGISVLNAHPRGNFRGGGSGMSQDYRGQRSGSSELREARQAIRTEMANARFEVLAEMTGETADALKIKAATKRFPDLLEEYNIDSNTFHNSMKTKAEAVIDQAVASGKITQEQGEQMKQRVAQGPQDFRGRGQRRSPGQGYGQSGQGRRGMGRSSGDRNGQGYGPGAGYWQSQQRGSVSLPETESTAPTGQFL